MNEMERVMQRLSRQHSWYVELVCRSKVAEMIGHDPSIEELREHGKIIETPNGQHHVVYDGITLISYNRDAEFNAERNTFGFNYLR